MYEIICLQTAFIGVVCLCLHVWTYGREALVLTRRLRSESGLESPPRSPSSTVETSSSRESDTEEDETVKERARRPGREGGEVAMSSLLPQDEDDGEAVMMETVLLGTA